SKLYKFNPAIVILAVQAADIVPDLWENFADLDKSAIDSVVERTIQTYGDLVQAYRANSNGHLVIHTLQEPPYPAPGILDSQESGQSSAVRRINDALNRIAGEQKNVYLLDYNNLIARRGYAAWHDPRKWVTARMPIAANELIHLANEWLRFLHPLTGRVCKA